jgi:tRNA(Ile)-lysidine synthase
MALTLLADEWTRARGGTLYALTVDHGLRPESKAEARRVGAWLKGRGIFHKVLTWTGEKPTSGLQAAARQKRYELLEAWCRAKGVLHLLLAHNLEDQAETFLMRLGRGSGLAGLSGIAPVEYLEGVRLVRPLLAIPKARLVATLEGQGQPWVEDPSNLNEKFLRVRARTILAGLTPEGLEAARVADAVSRLRRASDAIERQVADALVGAVTVYPEGYARLDAGALLRVPEEVSLRALARVLMCVSGSIYPPRFERLLHLHGELRAIENRELGRGRTLSGCRIMPATGDHRDSRFGLVIARELVAIGAAVDLRPGETGLWDGRFRVDVDKSAGGEGASYRVGPLGTQGWAEIREQVDRAKSAPIPAPALVVLPAFFDQDEIVAVPHINFTREGIGGAKPLFSTVFAPPVGLTA